MSDTSSTSNNNDNGDNKSNDNTNTPNNPNNSDNKSNDNTNTPNNANNSLPQLPNFLANEQTRKKFCALFEECVDTLANTFPECKQTLNVLKNFQTTIKNNKDKEDDFVKTWHRGMLKLYESADKHNEIFWTKPIPHLSSIDLASKVQDPGFGDESVLVLWEYIDGLNRHSRIYNAIPDQMFNQMHGVAMDYINKAVRGEMKLDLESLNFDDMEKVGKNIMKTFDPNDLNEFVGNITGLASSLKINNMQDVFKFIGDFPGMNEVMNGNSPVSGIFNQIFQGGNIGAGNMNITEDLLKDVSKMFGGGDDKNFPPQN
jgi:hypothetical protein